MRQSRKKKKITVKYILNNKINPIVEDGVEKYPLYIQVIYNKQNTKFPAFSFTTSYRSGLYCSIEKFEEKFNGKSVFEERIIRNIIERSVESSSNPDKDFSLKGFSNRLELWSTSYSSIFTKSLTRVIFHELGNALSYNEYIEYEQRYLDTLKGQKLSEKLYSFLLLSEFYEGNHKDLINLFSDSFVLRDLGFLIDFLRYDEYKFRKLLRKKPEYGNISIKNLRPTVETNYSSWHFGEDKENMKDFLAKGSDFFPFSNIEYSFNHAHWALRRFQVAIEDIDIYFHKLEEIVDLRFGQFIADEVKKNE